MYRRCRRCREKHELSFRVLLRTQRLFRRMHRISLLRRRNVALFGTEHTVAIFLTQSTNVEIREYYAYVGTFSVSNRPSPSMRLVSRKKYRLRRPFSSPSGLTIEFYRKSIFLFFQCQWRASIRPHRIVFSLFRLIGSRFRCTAFIYFFIFFLEKRNNEF